MSGLAGGDRGARRRGAGDGGEPDARKGGTASRGIAGDGGAVADFAGLPAAIAAADLVISCTGAANLVITEAIVAEALAGRQPGRSSCCSTSRCRGMSILRSATCPVCP